MVERAVHWESKATLEIVKAVASSGALNESRYNVNAEYFGLKDLFAECLDWNFICGMFWIGMRRHG